MLRHLRSSGGLKTHRLRPCRRLACPFAARGQARLVGGYELELPDSRSGTARQINGVKRDVATQPCQRRESGRAGGEPGTGCAGRGGPLPVRSRA